MQTYNSKKMIEVDLERETKAYSPQKAPPSQSNYNRVMKSSDQINEEEEGVLKMNEKNKTRRMGKRTKEKGESDGQFVERKINEKKLWDEWTNQILVHNYDNFNGVKDKTILVPIYTKVIIKKLKNFKMTEGSGIILFTQLIWINCKDGPQEIIDYLMDEKRGLKCRRDFSTEQWISCENSTIKNNEGIISITVRDELEVSIEGSMVNFPFTEFYASFNFELSQMSVNIQGEDYTVRFVFHQSDSIGDMLNAKDAVKEQYDFKIAYLKFKTEFPSDSKKNSLHDELLLKYYPTADYKIALYQEPFGIIITIYLPILVLSFICMAIFATSYDLGGRLASIATLALAYIAFIPTVRSIIPPVSYVTLGDMLVQFNLAGCTILLLSSYLSQKWEITGFIEEMHHTTLASLFVTASFLFGFPFLLVFYQTLHFYLYKKKQLFQSQQRSSKTSPKPCRDAKKGVKDFDYENWFQPHIYEIAKPSLVQRWSEYKKSIKPQVMEKKTSNKMSTYQ